MMGPYHWIVDDGSEGLEEPAGLQVSVDVVERSGRVVAAVGWPTVLNGAGDAEEYQVTSWFEVPEALEEAQRMSAQLGLPVLITLQSRSMWQDEWGQLAPQPGLQE